MDSLLTVLTAAFKLDESTQCNKFDGTSNVSAKSVVCNTAPYNVTSPYCTCNMVAGNPDMVYMNATKQLNPPLQNGSNVVKITIHDVCTTSAVPAALQPSAVTTFAYHEDEFITPEGVYAQTLARLLSAPGPGPFADPTTQLGVLWNQRKATWAGLVFDAFLSSEDAFASGDDSNKVLVVSPVSMNESRLFTDDTFLVVVISQ